MRVIYRYLLLTYHYPATYPYNVDVDYILNMQDIIVYIDLNIF